MVELVFVVYVNGARAEISEHAVMVYFGFIVERV